MNREELIEHISSNRAFVFFDAYYKRNGEWYPAIVVGVTDPQTYEISMDHIFCYERGELKKRQWIDNILIYGANRSGDTLSFVGSPIKNMTRILTVHGRMHRIIMGMEIYKSYLEEMWIRGHVNVYDGNSCALKYLRLPRSVGIVRTTVETDIIGIETMLGDDPIEPIINLSEPIYEIEIELGHGP